MYVHVVFYGLAYLFVCFGVIKQSDPMFILNAQHNQYFSWRRLDTSAIMLQIFLYNLMF